MKKYKYQCEKNCLLIHFQDETPTLSFAGAVRCHFRCTHDGRPRMGSLSSKYLENCNHCYLLIILIDYDVFKAKHGKVYKDKVHHDVSKKNWQAAKL